LAAIAVVCASALTAACSQSGSAEQLQSSAPLSVSTKANTILLQNRAGMPLNDVQVTVVAYGGKAYSQSMGRLESDASRPVLLSELASSDHAAFNAAFNKPKTVRVQATDATGKTLAVDVPWK
jgi:hypothetical protein